ncbi:sugar-binding domain-containing protein [Mucilaginibacter sp. PAMB04168]|uniref:glycoside hydrolase family 2 protein n=1 Tax=Mucilaginibacter sp. PAMB04168 TaxID=3138567 RepID=UPI0031F68C49
MQRKHLLTTLCAMMCLALQTSAQTTTRLPVARAKYNFNPDWKLYPGDTTGAEKPDFNDAGWKNVTLPHAFNEDDAFKKDIHDLTVGISWYRKKFQVPQGSAGKKLFLEFEGIRQAGEFFLNGKPLGLHENGIMAFGFDITNKVNPTGDNEIAVRVDNRWDYREKSTNSTFQWNNANFYANYGGINKNVNLYVTDRLYQTLPLYSSFKTTGTYIYPHNFDVAARKAVVTTETQVKNEYEAPKNVELEVIVADRDGKIIKTAAGAKATIAPGQIQILKADIPLTNLNFWSWGYGYLYDVYTVLKVDGAVVDVVKTQTGFRKTEFGNGMVKLNDRVIQMHGYAQRSTNEWPALGTDVPAWISDYSNGMMVESNGNLVRWMHVTPSKQDVESCDRVGLIQAMPAGDAEGDPKDRRWEHRLEVMRDAMVYNRNNPSIVFYESGNKGITEEHMKDMKAIRDEFDPHGGRASGSREMLDSKVAEYGGEMLYINKSAKMPFWAMEYSRDEALRKYWDEYSPPFHKNGDGPKYKQESGFNYNRNQDSHAVENAVRWYDYWRERPGTGKRVSSGGVNIVFSDSNTHFRGTENYRRSGEVDALRIPKDGFYTHKVVWDGWVDPNKNGIHLVGHWNYKSGIKKDVYVISTGDKVQLLLNGKSLGYGTQSNQFVFTFKNIAWQPGQLKAISFDKTGKKLNEETLTTAGDPVAVRLTPHTSPTGLMADGADLALVDVEVVDAKGQRCPTALNMINFTLNGPAEWRGGLAQGPGNYILVKTLPVECGVNRVILRSLPQAGAITLQASADGLKSANINLTSKPVQVNNGLTAYFSASALKGSLKRGPTPQGPSYTLSRKAIDIASVTAGSNNEKANGSYDDNEITSWASDGQLQNGWIKYTFAKPERVDEVTLKLDNWRNRRYPIRIKVDGKVVYSGETTQSLGYVTLPVKSTQGSTLTVELAGANTDKDGFGLVEVTGKKDAAGAVIPDKKAILGINEIEIYHKL